MKNSKAATSFNNNGSIIRRSNLCLFKNCYFIELYNVVAKYQENLFDLVDLLRFVCLFLSFFSLELEIQPKTLALLLECLARKQSFRQAAALCHMFWDKCMESTVSYAENFAFIFNSSILLLL